MEPLTRRPIATTATPRGSLVRLTAVNRRVRGAFLPAFSRTLNRTVVMAIPPGAGIFVETRSLAVGVVAAEALPAVPAQGGHEQNACQDSPAPPVHRPDATRTESVRQRKRRSGC